jgi:hypothetical protein
LDLREDTVVAILFTANAPFVLRQRREAFDFQGDNYVRKIMQGELIAAIENNGGRLEGPKFMEFKMI